MRFIYDYVGGGYYNYTSPGVGFYLDDIAVSNAEELINTIVTDIADATTFAFAPNAATNYSLRVRTIVADHTLDWGPAALTSVSPLVIHIKGAPTFAAGGVQIRFELISGAATNFQVETSASPFGPWTKDLSALVQTLVPGNQFQATASTGPGGHRFYRIVAP